MNKPTKQYDVDDSELYECQECKMLVFEDEYHPYGACLMFKACKNGNTVRQNLMAITDHVENNFIEDNEK